MVLERGILRDDDPELPLSRKLKEWLYPVEGTAGKENVGVSFRGSAGRDSHSSQDRMFSFLEMQDYNGAQCGNGVLVHDGGQAVADLGWQCEEVQGLEGESVLPQLQVQVETVLLLVVRGKVRCGVLGITRNGESKADPRARDAITSPRIEKLGAMLGWPSNPPAANDLAEPVVDENGAVLGIQPPGLALGSRLCSLGGCLVGSHCDCG